MKRFVPILGLVFLVSILAAGPAWCAPKTEPSPDAVVQASPEELRTLVRLLEDETARRTFVKHLKTLIQLQELEAGSDEKAAQSTGTLERLFDAFDRFANQTLDQFRRMGQEFARLPEKGMDLAVFFLNPANRTALGYLALYTLAGMLAGLGAFSFLRRTVSEPPLVRPGLWRVAGIALVRFLSRAVPWAVMLLIVFMLYGLTPALPLARNLVIIALVILCSYEAVAGLSQALLSPEGASVRLIPLRDENANYLYVWLIRLARYTAFYFLVRQGFALLDLTGPTYVLIQNGLFLLFPLIVTIFIMQGARELRARYTAPPAEPEAEKSRLGLAFHLALRYWAWPTSILIWVTFIFQLAQFRTGFDYLLSGLLGTVIVGLVLVVVLATHDLGFKKLFSVGELVRVRFPGLEEKANRYLRAVQALTRTVILLAALIIATYVWGVPWGVLLASSTGSLILARGMVILVTLVLISAVMGGSQIITDWLLHEEEGKEIGQKLKTLAPLINTTLKALTGFVGAVVVLDRLGIDIKPILAGAGIVGLGVGLGSQSLVKDVINGLFILFQDILNVGDWVTVGDKSGLVESIGLRALRLRDLAGNVHVIPNSAVETVTNMTKGFSRYVFDVGVAYREDVDEVIEVLREIGTEMEADPVFGPDMTAPLEILGLDRFDDSAVVIRARATTKPMRQWAVGREFNRRMKKRFDEQGIEIPFPHRTVYMGLPKDGPAPPLEVRVEKEREV